MHLPASLNIFQKYFPDLKWRIVVKVIIVFEETHAVFILGKISGNPDVVYLWFVSF